MKTERIVASNFSQNTLVKSYNDTIISSNPRIQDFERFCNKPLCHSVKIIMQLRLYNNEATGAGAGVGGTSGVKDYDDGVDHEDDDDDGDGDV